MLSSITLTHTCKLPRNVTRQAVIEFLHSHEDIIDLSPLVKERHPIKAPASAPPHLQHASWWSITDKISYLPGHLLNGTYTYTGAFVNKSTGLEAYIDAPAGTTLKDVWSVVQSPSSSSRCPYSPSSSKTTAQPGETDLCIRVDSSARCHFALRGFVRKMLKKSHAELVRRLAAKTQLNASAFGWSDSTSTSMSMSNDDFESVILRSKPSREWGGNSGGGYIGTETPSPTETITSSSSFFPAVAAAPTVAASTATSPPLASLSEIADLYSFATHTGPFTAAEQAQTWSIPDSTADLQTGYNAWSAGRFWESDYRAHVGLSAGRGQTV
ncbi:hypothetical protein PG993_006054 [Apiospora rasikravindrae]|uniref:DUF7053 domain-containing protein n=1 Tax=Apiospora rasikravindrae TaxID=990691 RepID=A0ABR1TCX3_9PEZI